MKFDAKALHQFLRQDDKDVKPRASKVLSLRAVTSRLYAVFDFAKSDLFRSAGTGHHRAEERSVDHIFEAVGGESYRKSLGAAAMGARITTKIVVSINP